MEITVKYLHSFDDNDKKAIKSIIDWAIDHTNNLVTAIEVANKIAAKTLPVSCVLEIVENNRLPQIQVSKTKTN